jgi:peroxiredoxin
MPIAVGSQAPAFTLKSKTDAGLVDVSLAANLGQKNTVILFFPLAFTGVCTQELCDITSGLSQYASLGADVIAISVDSPFAQEAWAKQHKIGIRIGSDLNKNGVVQYAEQTPTPKDLPNFEAIKAVLAGLK